MNVRATRCIGGPVAQVNWVTEFESLAAYEAMWAKLEADPGYNALLQEAREQGYFDAARLSDALHQVIG